MMAKVQWYEEVLSIDPTSKVFLPYAKELLEGGDIGKAISVLRRGLTHCPDYEEARVLLIHALYVSGRDRDAVDEARRFVCWADDYPGFWSAVLEAKSEGCPDASLYIRLADGVIKGRACTLSDVFKHGVDAVLGVGPMPTAPVDSGVCRQTEVVDGDSVKPSVNPGEETSTGKDSDGDSDLGNGYPDAGEDERPLTVRTRSMAALLAEQGDVRGALDIYGEILLAQPDDEDLARIVERLTEQLNAPVGMPFQPVAKDAGDVPEAEDIVDVPVPEGPAKEMSDEDDGQSDMKLLLARLADRLDARARSEE